MVKRLVLIILYAFTESCSQILSVWARSVSVVVFGVDMAGSTRRGHGVDVRPCWVPCND